MPKTAEGKQLAETQSIAPDFSPGAQKWLVCSN